MKFDKVYKLLIAGCFMCGTVSLYSQETENYVVEEVYVEENTDQNPDSIASEYLIPPLFEYPVAPDDSPDLKSRTNYLMEHFWEPFDFKGNKVVDQNALNHAFGVYVGSMPYADYDKVMESVKKIIGNIKNNPGLSYQFTKAAEENLYGPRADMWIDEVYIMFLDNLMSNKKIDKTKKARYEEQLRILKSTQPGAPLPSLTIKKRDGSTEKFKATKDYTIIEFGNPECDDCHLAQFRMQISGAINDLLEEGILDVAFLIPEDDEGLIEKTSSYPATWIIGYAENADEEFDLRATPAIYVVDGKGNIIAKNVGVETAIGIVEESVKNSKK